MAQKFQGGPLEIRKCESHLVGLIRINGIAAEEEIAKENEVIKLSGFRTVKSIGIGFLSLGFLDRGFTIAELLNHEHNCFS